MSHLLTGNLTITKGQGHPSEYATTYESFVKLDKGHTSVSFKIKGTRDVEYQDGTHVFVTSATLVRLAESGTVELEVEWNQVEKIAEPGADVMSGVLASAAIGRLHQFGGFEEMESSDPADPERMVLQAFAIDVGAGRVARALFCRPWSKKDITDPRFSTGTTVHGSGKFRAFDGSDSTFGLVKMGVVPEHRRMKDAPAQSAGGQPQTNTTAPTPTKTVAQPTKTVAQPAKTVAQPAKTVAQPSKFVLNATASSSSSPRNASAGPSTRPLSAWGVPTGAAGASTSFQLGPHEQAAEKETGKRGRDQEDVPSRQESKRPKADATVKATVDVKREAAPEPVAEGNIVVTASTMDLLMAKVAAQEKQLKELQALQRPN